MVHAAMKADTLVHVSLGVAYDASMASRGAPRMPLPTRSTSRTREDVRPALREGDQRTCGRRDRVPISTSGRFDARSIGQRPDTIFSTLLTASAAPSTMPSEMARGAENLGQEERQDRIDGFGRRIGRQADPSEQPDRLRELQHVAGS